MLDLGLFGSVLGKLDWVRKLDWISVKIIELDNGMVFGYFVVIVDYEM